MRVQEDASEPRDTSRTGQSSTSQQHHERDEDDENVHGHHRRSYSHTHFRTYKRRWFGLAQLVLLNIVVSWDWLTFAPISTTAAEYYGVSETAINWLTTAFLFAFVAICPLTIWTLHRGPKESIMCASVLLLVGNWIRYAGTRASDGIYGVVMFGQILTGFAQPFVLAAPTRYSDLWYTEAGRVRATAVASLANPFGGAIAQLVNPFLGSVSEVVLYVSIIATIACIPSFFIPASPPTPPSASWAISKTPILHSIKHMLQSPPFYIVLLAFSIYVGFFNAFSSLLNQILYPYGFSEDEAGICGAVLIVVGLIASAITSPIFDRTHKYLLGIKVLCPLIAISYLGLIWAPQTRGLPAPYVLSAILGAASFSLLPITLEYLVEITFPASPEVSSTICWSGGQLLGGVFIVIMNALKNDRPVDLEVVREAGRGQSRGASPPGHMRNALIFQAVIACAVLPLIMALGSKKLKLSHGEGRLQVDEHREEDEVVTGQGP
ncbi:MFS general substrate transporter [Corynespora cassiicola Philippines]|uniref:MFS general substrate transporter n=1 Tax=Corynespora cassiicola Philippines TaxID=1448308 RepID=A0A2T2P7Y2_CORCC|nr:MFS general substrate transporter [Corynespora cassiicola Philippines]